MLWNLGPAKADGLAKVGITTITQLAEADPNTLLGELTDAGIRHSMEDLRGWQAHIAAYRTQAPVVFNRLEVPEPPYYLLDTEYDTTNPTSNPIFLLAIGTVPPSGDLEKPRTWWAPTPELEHQALVNLREVIDDNPDWPIVTYHGSNADLPRLREAQHRFGIVDITEQITVRHVDMFLAVKAALRLPTAQLSLKAVEPFAGIEREGSLADAESALAAYKRIRRRPDQGAIAALVTYAAEDIVGLAEVLTYLREISGSVCSP
ncbi:MAG: ribonuclease H-like domain-containing protein [Acidimicrobiia bacterium]|nr:ribonuclease H-like domain-containing protein [Acidimicrobiia bacterium]